MCSYLMLEIISFVSLKNDSLLFSTREHVKGELSSPKWRVAHEGEGGLTDFRVGLRPWRTLRNISFEAAI